MAPIFKPTYFDDNKIDCMKVGPGIYNPYKVFFNLDRLLEGI